MIVRVCSVVLRRTVVGVDWRFDNLIGSHHQLWWWLPLRLSKRQSTPTTVLLRTTLQTRTITQTTTLKQPSSLLKFLKIFENCHKSSEIFESLRKKSENVGKFSKRSSDTVWKFSKIFGNLRKCSETLGNFSNVIGGLWKLFILCQSDTCRLKIRFKNFDL